MFGGGETAVFYRAHISFDGSLNAALAVHKVFDEAGGFARVDAEHIVHYQHLAVAAGAGADADGGRGDGLGYAGTASIRIMAAPAASWARASASRRSAASSPLPCTL